MRMRYRQTALAGIAALTLVLAACGGDDDDDAAQTPGGEAPAASTEGMLTALGAGEGQVNLIAWAGYVEDGSTDPKVDWVSDFTKKTGCKVKVTLGNSSDEMVTLMKTGKYDGVSASGDASLRLIQAERRRAGQRRPAEELRRHLRRA